MEKMKIKERVNWPVTILLLLGLITVAFPLYMTIVIALKKPSEMTNSISGILSLPSHLSLDNFAEAMRVTDFWHSLGNSVFITLVTVVLSILIHSLLGYAIGRNKKSKFYKFIYFYVVSGMFVPFAILMMPVVKQTAQMGLANRAGVIILYVVFYMPMNLLLYSGYLKNIPLALEEAARVDGAGTWKTYWSVIFPIMTSSPDNGETSKFSNAPFSRSRVIDRAVIRINVVLSIDPIIPGIVLNWVIPSGLNMR